MTGRYVVAVADLCGSFLSEEATDLAGACAIVARLAPQYFGRRYEISVANLDNVDLGWSDGLSDEERLTVSIATVTAQAAHAVQDGRPRDAHALLDLADRYLLELAS